MRYWFALAGLEFACTQNAVPSDVILLTGQETDTWTASPKPTSALAELVAQDQRHVIGQAPLPTTGFAIDSAPVVPDGTIATFEITGLDTAGSTVLRGKTVPFAISSLEGISVPIFAGRTGAWSRPLGAWEHPHQHAVLTTALAQYVIAAGGDAPAANPIVPDLYDASNWEILSGQPALPRVPRSMASVGAALLIIDDVGATWLNLANDATNDPAAPSGLSFAEVAGGATIALPDGTVYIVGGTRSSGEATTKVLRIDSAAGLKSIALATPRLGAAAAVIGGTLVVAGGSAQGAGVEVLAPTEDSFAPLAFPADPTVGLAVAGLTSSSAILVGGADPTGATASPARTIDLTCTTACIATPADVTSPALSRASAFALAISQVLVVGESADGETQAFWLDLTGAAPTMTERPLRERRKGASAITLPNGQVGIVGGAAVDSGAPVSSLEVFFP